MADSGVTDPQVAADLKKKRTFRTFSYRGVELDKLLDLSNEEFVEIVHARARRRFQRGLKRRPMGLIKKLRKAKKEAPPNEKPAVVKTHLRDMIVVPEMIGSVVGIYNGKVFNPVEVKPEMVGHYLGEFSVSYRPVKHGRPGIGATHCTACSNHVMTTELPYAADAHVSLSYDELEVLKLQYQRELAQAHVTTQTKFNYAWGLVKSPLREQQVEGVRLLQEIYRAEPSRRRECLYYLALGHYKMGNFEEAKNFNALLLDREPANLQAQSLGLLIEKGVKREGYIGMALAGGAAAIGTLLIANLIRRATRK
ncbi:hypothetical protein EW146_g9446 [Bondarzewia mesenterica]|uniref:Mitochondrial fission 1 protein n=1 Tax=Bondarzewia mesenterica TaxID=1095465 RepID=A0A4S4L6G7_9AGAM|nr:hypothetical protein EW146_g9446 [Bondarzewia mesenterica]